MSSTVTETLATHVALISGQPDIEYHPDSAKYRARTASRLASDPSLLATPLPEGFPAKLEGPIIWEGRDWTQENHWIYRLTNVEITEIDEALAYFKALSKPLGYISSETFPLPTLGTPLKAIAKELYHGKGFSVVRGIPVDKYSREDLAIVYAGVSSYIGPSRGKQDKANAMLAHVKNLTVSHAAQGASGQSAYTTEKQVFHTDAGDLVGLLVIQSAAEGGLFRMSSCGRIYNELAATRPDLIKVLSEPWPLDSFGGDPGYVMRPLLFIEDGEHAVIQYSRRKFTGYGAQKRSPHIPPITEAQAEALDALHFLAEKFSLGIQGQKGDIQYINNVGLVHAREAFRDDSEHIRHLIRLWLRDDELAWKTPKALQRSWSKLYSVPADDQQFPLEPEVAQKQGGVAI
ncbi:hypothetical protein HGRIS_014388 [Hohenbuehelia grisea]|uniref:TauD/TfdA-like domain-containing protein n=1 Tax=Hohenbuehelia grisea TaxID=104357 RepID=A0ABR3JT90_9AGAR